MLPVSELLKSLQKTVSENSPAILTALGVTGTLSTAVLTARAAFRVGKDVNAGHYEPLMEGLEPEYYTPQDLVKTYWRDFIPPMAVGVSTVVAIVAANQISSKRSTAIFTAYSLSEKAYSEYKDKIVEQIGANKEQKARDSIAQDHIDANPMTPSTQVIVTDNGEVLCYESITGRYFKSSIEALRRAENDINRQLLNEMYASLNDFNRLVGLPITGYGEEVGWTSEKNLDLQFTSALSSDDQKPCLAVGYRTLPFPKYDRFN